MQETGTSAITARIRAAEAIIREAGALALTYFDRLASLEVETKTGAQDVVTVADRAVEKLIRARIAALFPDDGLLGEEYGMTQGSSGLLWVVDPIDGTSCFLHGSASWCVAIALVRGGETLAGLILDPNRDELFLAETGGGALMNGKPVSVDPGTDLQHGLTSVGANFRVPVAVISSFIHNLLEAGGMFVRSGSGALSLAHVSCGRLAAYYEPHMNAWDCLAAQCLIREAGGWTNDFLAEGSLLGGGRAIGCAPQMRDALLQLIEASETGRPA
jgi:myo-inositol-1(or 4)-monophosphatase